MNKHGEAFELQAEEKCKWAVDKVFSRVYRHHFILQSGMGKIIIKIILVKGHFKLKRTFHNIVCHFLTALRSLCYKVNTKSNSMHDVYVTDLPSKD